MAVHYTDTIYQGVNHHNMQEGFVYDNIGMIYVKEIDGGGIDIRVLPKQEQDYFYDLLRGDSLGSGTSFPGTKKYGDRFYRTDLSKWYKWDGTDWIVYGETYYLMLDYFPTKSGYLKTGARVFRTDQDKEYRYNGSSWIEITATSGDAKKRIQSKDNMTVVTSNDESSSFYYRINETDVLLSEHWFVVPLSKYLGTGDSSAGLQVYWGKGKYIQRFQIDVSGLNPTWVIDSVDFTLQSQETVIPFPDIIDAAMTDAGGDIWYYDVTNFIGGLHYRKFTVNYHYDDPPVYDSYVDDLTGVIGRLLCDEYDPYYHTEAYSSIKYVNDTTGSDSDTGGISDPWKTIGHAASTVTSGTLVRVAAGTYTETADITPNSGTNVNLIHFHADGEVTVSAKFATSSDSYIICDRFTFTGKIHTGTSDDHILIINCKANTYTGFGDVIAESNCTNIFVIGNIIDLSNATAIHYGAGGSAVCIFNRLHIVKPYFNFNGLATFSTHDSINEIGSYYSAASGISSGDDCIGLSTFTYNNVSDTKPVIKLGTTFHKAGSINWLENHLKYGVAGLISYTFSPYLRHLKTVNVPTSGSTVPYSFVKIIDGNSKERLVAYGNKTEGTDYGACEIGENGEIIDGMANVKMQTVNGGSYSINPISRILDRNGNGEIIIEGRSIISED